MSLRCVIGWHKFKVAAHQRRSGLSLECCRCRHRLRVRRTDAAGQAEAL